MKIMLLVKNSISKCVIISGMSLYKLVRMVRVEICGVYNCYLQCTVAVHVKHR